MHTTAASFDALPKTELHLHLEGTVSPETLWAIAQRNAVALPAGSLEELRGLYDFEGFDTFLTLWLAMCRCFRTPADYEQMADAFVAGLRAPEHPLRRGPLHAVQPRALRVRRPARARHRHAPSGGAGGRGRTGGASHPRHPERVRAGERPLHRGAARGDREPARGRDRPGRARGRASRAPGRALLRPRARAPATPRSPTRARPAVPSTCGRRWSTSACGACSTACARSRTRRSCASWPSAQVCCDVALTSNTFLTPYRDLATHPIRALLAAGVPVTLSTDDPPFFGTDLCREYARAHTEAGLSAAELWQIDLNGLRYGLAATDRAPAAAARVRGRGPGGGAAGLESQRRAVRRGAESPARSGVPLRGSIMRAVHSPLLPVHHSRALDGAIIGPRGMTGGEA